MGARPPFDRILAALVVAAVAAGCAATADSPAPSSTMVIPAGPASTPVASSSAPGKVLPTPTQAPSPSPASDVSGITGFDAAARAFVDGFNADWADANAAFARFTDDAVIVDPSNADFTIGPGPEVETSWAAFAEEFPAYRATTTAAYASDVVAAIGTEVAGLPVGLPDGLLHELRVFRFADGTASRATAMELWYELRDRLADSENTRLDCVAPDRCVDDATDFAEDYLAAWTSGDEQAIAKLYRPDATFTDDARGIRATGAIEIGRLADRRFDSVTPVCQVRDVYVQTDDGDPRTSDNTDPKGGSVAGIAIAHRCELGALGGERPLDGLSLLLFGTRQAGSFDNDTDGLITTEEVLYDAASLTAAGLAP